ncbi:hypothetical protein [Novosphingobium sp. EMRT-2]|uniref:hypothetical protein n=1 Tax=Novosphingobium sp. EMRT-2 TaxID=2571749 RepID=UPI0010BD8DC8|nr:hypothetical protein [Novosphingobium sp. EMRT-2]QCI92812.1 hypothetical protein FA702_04070 [Novosphingobium sp. EMRT-2]
MKDEIETGELDPNAAVREKIESAKARVAASSPAKTVKTLVDEHPVAMLAGGILLGALVARAWPKRRSAAKEVVDSRLGKRAVALAALGAEIATAYATRAAEAGREGVARLEDIGGSVGGKIAEGGEEARKRAVDLTDVAVSSAREAGETALRRLIEIATRLRK